MKSLFGYSDTGIVSQILEADADDEEHHRNPRIPDNVVLSDAREDLRPKKEKITGDTSLPQYYNVRDAYPMC